MSVLSRVPNDALHGTPTHNMPVRQTGIQYGKSGVLGKRITRMYMIIHSTLSGVFLSSLTTRRAYRLANIIASLACIKTKNSTTCGVFPCSQCELLG